MALRGSVRSTDRSLGRTSTALRVMVLGVLIILIGAPFIGLSPGVEAATPTYLKYHHDNPSIPLTINGSQEEPLYYKVEFQNAKEYIVSGLYTYYRTTVAESWEGRVELQDWTSSNLVSYDLSLPKNDVEGKPYYESFNGPEFMITSNMFSIAIYPGTTETAPVLIYAEPLDISVQTHTYYLQGSEGQWKPRSTHELILSAMVESVMDLESGDDGVSGSMSDKDNLDIYKVLFIGGKTYTIDLLSPSRKPYALRLYDVENVIREPIMEVTGMGDKDRMVFKPEEDVFLYLLIEYPNNGGFIDYQIKVLPNKPPEARIDGDTLVNVNETARFTAENSTDDDGDSMTYIWDFDASDGLQEDASKKTPSYVYRKPGDYVVTLTVTDGKENHTTTWDVKVNSLPTGKILVDGAGLNQTTRLNFDQEYALKADFKDPDGDAMTYTWLFGDGSSGTGQSVKHTYRQEGNYTITLTVKVRDVRAEVTGTLELTFNRLPEAKFDSPPESVTAGSKVTFDGIGRDWDGEVKDFMWDFDGDGSIDKTTQEPYADFKYKKAGTYNVTLSVSDDNGGIGVANITLVVNERPAEERNLGAVIGGVVALVIVLLIIIILVLKKQGKILSGGQPPGAGEGEVGDGAPPAAGTSPATTDPGMQTPQQQGPAYQQGPEAGQQPVEYQPSPYSQPQTGPHTVPPPRALQGKEGQAGPSLVPPPKPLQGKEGPTLVPPPKPAQEPKLVPPPKPSQ